MFVAHAECVDIKGDAMNVKEIEAEANDIIAGSNSRPQERQRNLLEFFLEVLREKDESSL